MSFQILVGVAFLIITLSIGCLEFVNRGSGREKVAPIELGKFSQATPQTDEAPKQGDGRRE